MCNELATFLTNLQYQLLSNTIRLRLMRTLFILRSKHTQYNPKLKCHPNILLNTQKWLTIWRPPSRITWIADMYSNMSHPNQNSLSPLKSYRICERRGGWMVEECLHFSTSSLGPSIYRNNIPCLVFVTAVFCVRNGWEGNIYIWSGLEGAIRIIHIMSVLCKVSRATIHSFMRSNARYFVFVTIQNMCPSALETTVWGT